MPIQFYNLTGEKKVDILLRLDFNNLSYLGLNIFIHDVNIKSGF